MTVEQAYELLFSGAFLITGLCILLCLIRSAIGPQITDRLVSVNMNTTMVVSLIAWLVVFLAEDWLADVALVYVLLGTVGMTVLAKVYLTSSEKKNSPETAKRGREEQKEEHHV